MQEIFLGNIKGEKGDNGSDFKALGFYSSLDELSAAITNPSAGDAYGIGSAAPYDIYIYAPNSGWVNNGPIQGAKGEQGEKGEKGDKGDAGENGADGTNATITGVTATVDETIGTPSVTVAMDGTESERSFAFAFSGLKGEKGEAAESGALLWENPDLSVGWDTTRQVHLSLTEYKRLTVIFASPIDNNTLMEVNCHTDEIGKTYHVNYVPHVAPDMCSVLIFRDFYLGDGYLEFRDCYIREINAMSNSLDDNRLIPYKIIGYKY